MAKPGRLQSHVGASAGSMMRSPRSSGAMAAMSASESWSFAASKFDCMCSLRCEAGIAITPRRFSQASETWIRARAVRIADPAEHRIGYHAPLAERHIGGDCDAVLCATLQHFSVLQEGMHLDLIGGESRPCRVTSRHAPGARGESSRRRSGARAPAASPSPSEST